MSVPQVALHIGERWTLPKASKSSQPLTRQCDVSSRKNPSLHLFSTLPLISQSLHRELILSLINKCSLHVTFSNTDLQILSTPDLGPEQGVSTNFYKITSLSFSSLSLQCLTKSFAQGARRGGGHAEITRSQSDSFCPFVYTRPYKCIKHISYSWMLGGGRLSFLQYLYTTEPCSPVKVPTHDSKTNTKP